MIGFSPFAQACERNEVFEYGEFEYGVLNASLPYSIASIPVFVGARQLMVRQAHHDRVKHSRFNC
jgi:hypothetical protein